MHLKNLVIIHQVALSTLSSNCLVKKSLWTLVLENCMRVVSSSSVNWLDQNISGSSGSTLTLQVLNPQALHSWVYPSSTLPPAVISVLASAASSTADTGYLEKLCVAWKESFRNLYYLFRNNGCNIFYVCTPHFVVMFTADTRTTKRSCNAYVSRSTTSLRKLLKDQVEAGFLDPLQDT